ncbi:nitrous oxide reductase family maturation protein NosD [Kitasatospora aureofaciens]|uniref:right-handed parallel beta-helix repeat-containing protein n=1 Tax=Kitasatospora aureofaciens TaxID=1894 RepID=UPI001C43E8E0|nr:right-handed parallel beta-helix repeat-containing protein [Kitasatospora aureofaciens]MBV6698931.1 right-handed parallel beta-helix repeat-containing protein [Kitasatospora aureofaciens]
MPTRRIHHLAAATAAATALTTALATLAATAPVHAAAGSLHLVHPGESIQRAVDAARPGDTVQVLPGTYPGSVRITTPGLTLRGTGPNSVITPGTGAENACAAAGHGVCVVGPETAPLPGLTIEAISVSGFRKNGIDITGTTGMTVRANFVHDNGEQGISQEVSTRAAIVGNDVHGNGQSGVFLANYVDRKAGAPAIGTVVTGNRLTDNRIGVTVRRLRGLSVNENDIRGNCGGVFIVGDETVPRAGDLDVAHNTVAANNKHCAPTPRLGAIQGAGIVLTGVEAARVTDNDILEHAGTSDFSGGIVLFKSVVGVPNARNTITGNRLSGNSPADIADRDTGTGNAFARNECSVSQPSGHC